MSDDIQPPPGFTLVTPQQGGDGPTPPPGFTLVQPSPEGNAYSQLPGKPPPIMPPPDESGSGVMSAETVPVPGQNGVPTFQQAQQKLVALTQAGKGQGDPEFDQALKDRANAAARLRMGGMQTFGGGVIAKPAPLATLGATAANVADKTIGAGARAVGEILPGSTAKSIGKLGETIAPTADQGLLGKSIQAKIQDAFTAARENRAGATDYLRDAAYDSDPATTARVVGQTRADLLDYYQKNYNTLGPSGRKFVNDQLKELSGTPTIEKLDDVRRDMGQIRAGKMEGAQGISIARAGDVGDIIEKNLRTIPDYNQYLDNYAKFSEPVNRFNTLGGQSALKMTKRAPQPMPGSDEIPPTVKDVEKLPDQVFGSRQQLQNFKGMVNDPQFVADAARQHVANSLDKLTFGKNIREASSNVNNWLHNNRDVLSDPDLANVARDAQEYAQILNRTRTVKRNLYITGSLGAMAYFTHPIVAARTFLSMIQ